MRSLRSRLLVFSLIVLGVAVLLLSALSYRQTVREFDELGDARLALATQTIDALAENAGLRKEGPGAPIDVLVWHSPFMERAVTDEGRTFAIRLGFQYWNQDGRLQLTSDNFQRVPLDAAPTGFADIALRDGHWRVYTLRDTDGDVVRVAEKDEARSALVRATLWEHLAPLVIVVPVLALLIAWSVRRALKPLGNLSEILATRQPEDPAPIALADSPTELAPVIASLNGLAERVQRALDRERQFAANAAHQLRTPLAAALLNLENAAAAQSDELRELALQRAQSGLGRLQRLIQQFLELARLESADRGSSRDRVGLEEILQSELDEAALLAADKDLEIALAIESPATLISGWEPAVRAMVRNLIDNAFRHSPVRGRVEARVSTSDDSVVLEISDSGTGIPHEERLAVLERFKRGGRADLVGTGLGLAIVQQVALLHGGQIELADSRFGSGLLVRLRFPKAPHPAANAPGVPA